MGRLVARVLVALLLAAAVVPLARAETGSTPVRLPVEPASPTSSHSVVVVKGDHLWKISARHLADVMGHKPLNSEISPYWRSVIETNRSNLRSGDPDLIYPGEVVTLPELTAPVNGSP